MVDILMATYNGEKYISEQINSIINQTYSDWNLYIHDDGSIDNTVEIIKSFSDVRIHFIEDGITFGNSTRNFLFLMEKCITADYFMFSDQDDFWLPNKIEMSLGFLMDLEKGNKSKPACIGTDLKVVNSSLEIIDNSFYNYSKFLPDADFHSLLIENVFTGCTMCMNKAVVSYIKKCNSHYDNIIQHDWFIALICASEGAVGQLNVPTMLYRQHGKNVVGANRFSILNSFKLSKLFGKLSKISKLKKDVFRQLEKVTDVIESEKNKKLIEDFISSKGIKHKRIIIKNKLARSLVNSKSMQKVLLY